MKNLKNESIKTMDTIIRSVKGWRILFALVLVVSSLFTLAPMQVAQADDGGVKGHTFDVTFIKWGITQPANPPSMAGVIMAGVVGGDVGKGRFAGEVLSDDFSVPGFWMAHARYEFYGKKHSFIADVHVKENLATNKAVVTGVVIQGWLKGSQVTGEWTDMPVCPIATPASNLWAPDCIPGTLHIQSGRGS